MCKHSFYSDPTNLINEVVSKENPVTSIKYVWPLSLVSLIQNQPTKVFSGLRKNNNKYSLELLIT